MNAAEIITIILAAFLCIRLTVAIVNVITWPRLNKSDNNEADVSILIPARDEEKNIGKLLASLVNMKVKEIIVLDDHSSDATASIVKEYSNKHKHIKLIEGKPLPQGWLGKNYACHQLAQQASGKYLLFIDADVMLMPQAVPSASHRMDKERLSLLSIFPDQQMDTAGEKLVVPFMHYFLLSLLPLRLVLHSSKPSLSAANGQFMMFDVGQYKKSCWHEKVKDKIVEDVEIMRAVKNSGMKGEVLLANGLVKCRMYNSGTEAIKGFSKNLLPGLGNVPALVIYFSLICWLWPVVLFINEPVWLVPLIVASLLIRVLISMLSNQNVLSNTILHPVQLLAFSCIAVNSVYLHLSGNVTWKGRKV